MMVDDALWGERNGGCIVMKAEFEAREIDFQHRWHQAHIAMWEALDERGDWYSKSIAPHAEESRRLLARFVSHQDLSVFRAERDC